VWVGHSCQTISILSGMTVVERPFMAALDDKVDKANFGSEKEDGPELYSTRKDGPLRDVF
jgi:hypothetical protein